MVHLAVISPTFPSSKLLAFKVSLKSLDHPSTSSNPISPTWGFLAPERSMVVSTKKPGSHFKHLRTKKSQDLSQVCRVKNGEKVLKKCCRISEPTILVGSPSIWILRIRWLLLKNHPLASWGPQVVFST